MDRTYGKNGILKIVKGSRCIERGGNDNAMGGLR